MMRTHYNIVMMCINSLVAIGFVSQPLSIAVVEFLGTNVCFGYNLTVHIAHEKESVAWRSRLYILLILLLKFLD